MATRIDGEVFSMSYLSGFGNYFSTEALPASLPIGRNNPQHAPRGLYAEQLNGSAFTAPNAENQRTWLYRIMPSVVQSGYKLPNTRLATSLLRSSPCIEMPAPPDQLRWDPLPLPVDQPTDLIE